jgi:hypothetical protein
MEAANRLASLNATPNPVGVGTALQRSRWVRGAAGAQTVVAVARLDRGDPQRQQLLPQQLRPPRRGSRCRWARAASAAGRVRIAGRGGR